MSTVMNPISSAGLRTPRLATTTLSEVMTINPVTLPIDATPAEAYATMREAGIRHLPILENGRLVGLLSQRDLYHEELIRGGRDGYPSVGHAMKRAPYVAAPGDCVGPVARTMSERRYGCVIVLDREHVVGIFTASDALALLATAFER